VHLLLGVLELRDEETADRAEARAREAGGADLRSGLLETVADNQARPDLTRLYTVLSAESVAPEHLGHAHFQERYRTVRAAMSHAVREAQESGELDRELSAREIAFQLDAFAQSSNARFQLYRDKRVYDDARSAIRHRLESLRPARAA
jgi:hypothetical protein